jgi:hypothetical protein
VNEPTAGLAFLYVGIIAGAPGALAILIALASRRGKLATWVACGLGILAFVLIGPVVSAPLIENAFDRSFFNGILTGLALSAIAATLVVTAVRQRRPHSNNAVVAMISAGSAIVVMIGVMIVVISKGAASVPPR